MNTNITTLFMTTVASIIGIAHASAAPSMPGCEKLAAAFLENPTKATMSSLQSDSKSRCWSVFNSSDANLGKLLHKAQKGNYWAAVYIGENLKETDGANLEDALVALGQFSDNHMETSLLLVKEGVISESELIDAVRMFPDSTSEDQSAQLAVMQARAKKVKQVTRKDLVEQKASTLKAIDGFIAEIKASRTER